MINSSAIFVDRDIRPRISPKRLTPNSAAVSCGAREHIRFILHQNDRRRNGAQPALHDCPLSSVWLGASPAATPRTSTSKYVGDAENRHQ